MTDKPLRPPTPQMEAFAYHYAQSGNGYAAAIEAGYSENYAKACLKDILGNPRIEAAVIKHRAQLATKAQHTRESAATRQEEISTAAEQHRQFGPAAQAAMNAARIRGQVVEKRADVTTDDQKERAEAFGASLSPEQVTMLEQNEQEDKVH